MKSYNNIKYASIIAWHRAVAELRAESTRTYAGYAWWVAEPLLMLVIYYFAFGVILNRQDTEFVPFIFIGLTFWRWFILTTMRNATSISDGAGLSSMVYIHKVVFPLTSIFVNSIKFLCSLMVILVMLVYYGYTVGFAWLALPAVMLAFFLFISGVGLIFAACVPFCVDFLYIISNVLTGLMFFSGVFYDMNNFNIGNNLLRIYNLNPIARTLGNIRGIMLHNQWPAWQDVAYISVVGAVLCYAGLLIITRYDRIYPKMG